MVRLVLFCLLAVVFCASGARRVSRVHGSIRTSDDPDVSTNDGKPIGSPSEDELDVQQSESADISAEAAAGKVQAVYRGHVARKKLQEEDADSDDDASVVGKKEGGEVSEVLHLALWIIQKASVAFSAYMKYNNLKLALKETKVALESAQSAVEMVGSKLLRIAGHLSRATFSSFMTAVETGSLDFGGEDDDEGAGEDDAMTGKVDFYGAIDNFESLGDDFDELTDASSTIVGIFEHVRGISDDLTKLGEDVLDGLNTTEMLAPLEEQANAAHDKFEAVVGQIKAECATVRPAMEELVKSAVSNASSAVKAKFDKTFGELSLQVESIQQVYDSVVKPLVLKLVEAVRSLLKAARKMNIDVGDRPDSATDETIPRRLCSWRNSHWFRSIEDYNVDIGKTMKCSKKNSWGKFKCSCVGINDCYVTTIHRPEPKSERRCFKMA